MSTFSDFTQARERVPRREYLKMRAAEDAIFAARKMGIKPRVRVLGRRRVVGEPAPARYAPDVIHLPDQSRLSPAPCGPTKQQTPSRQPRPRLLRFLLGL